LTGADLREFITAIGEALANAIEHAKATDPIEISACLVDDDIVMATVVDTGIGFSPGDIGERALPPTLSERGRGLPIMKSYVDLFTVRSEPGRGTAVILGRYLPGGLRVRTGSRCDRARRLLFACPDRVAPP